MNIQWKGSPNFDSDRKPITHIVCHWFGTGTLESANARFQNSTSQVSAHYGISNKTIYQWVNESDVAYHAGSYPMNQKSIGIEHDATTDHPASEDTYKTSAELIREIVKKYDILVDRQHIIKHNEVTATQCPGTLDIDRIIAMVKENGDICIKLSEDIPSFVEDKYNLKSNEWYNKLWKLEDLIENLVRTHDYLDSLQETYEKTDKENKFNKQIIEQNIIDIKTRDEQIETLQKSSAELTAQLSIMSEEKKSAIDEKNATQVKFDALTTKFNVQSKQLGMSQSEVETLNRKVSQKLRGYTKRELVSALFGIY